MSHPRAPPTPLQRADQLPTREPRDTRVDSPEGLGPPCPPTCLGPKGVKPETPDTVIRSRCEISTLAGFATHESDLLAKTYNGKRGKSAHRLRPISTDPGRQEIFPPGISFLRARYLLRRRALQRAAEKAPTDTFVRCLLPKSLTTSTRTRQIPVRPRDLRRVRNDGLWGPPRSRGRGRTRCVRVSASADRIHPWFGARDHGGDVLHRRGPCGQPLLSLSPLPLRL